MTNIKKKTLKLQHKISMIESHGYILDRNYNEHKIINEAVIYNLMYDIEELLNIIFGGFKK